MILDYKIVRVWVRCILASLARISSCWIVPDHGKRSQCYGIKRERSSEVSRRVSIGSIPKNIQAAFDHV